MIVMGRVFYSALDGKYHKYQGQPEHAKKFEGGVVTTTDIADIEATVILDEVLGLARPQCRLRSICRPVRMDNLVQRVDLGTILSGQEKVPPLVEAELSSQGYSDVDFALWKNVVHVAISDEAGMKAAHDILGLHIQDAAAELSRMENDQIATEVETNVSEKVATSVYSDWGAVTSGVSDTNPLEAILTSADYIMEQGYGQRGFFMAAHPTIWHKFVLNSWIKELVEAKILILSDNGFKLPLYPPFRAVSDVALTAVPTGSVGPIIGADQSFGVLLGEGPTSAAKYRNEPSGYVAYIIRQWLQPKVTVDAALDMICT